MNPRMMPSFVNDQSNFKLKGNLVVFKFVFSFFAAVAVVVVGKLLSFLDSLEATKTTKVAQKL